MKLFIAGASGIVGRDLRTVCDKEGVAWTGTYHSRPFPGGVQVDFSKAADVKKAVVESGASVVVNCIVERFTDVCEKDWNKTLQANVCVAERLASVCKELGLHLIHISTDYVFDGRMPPFSTESPVNPLQNYGISKLIAELRVRSVWESTAIVRVPVLYTDSHTYLDETAVTTIAKKVFNPLEATTEDNVSVRRPVYIPDFCEYLLVVAREARSGVLHFYNSVNKTTKYEMALAIGKYLRLPTDHIRPIDSFGEGAANRPIDTQLVTAHPDAALYKSLPIAEGIERCFKDVWFPPIKEDPSKFAFFFDLDGTLVDTDTMHYKAYKSVLLNWYGIELPREEFDYAIHCGSLESVLRKLGVRDITIVRDEKTRILSESKESVQLMKGARQILALAHLYNIPVCVVTNTSYAVARSFQSRCPDLQAIRNWVYRDDYTKPKPDPECFEYAKRTYGEDKEYSIFFENSANGVRSALGVSKRVFCITNKEDYGYKYVKALDCMCIPDFNVFLSAHS